MIQSLKLKNFQSHKDSLLEFSPGVNLIIGKTDSGKTAVLRALNWIINNKPAGDSFRSSWGGDTSCQITLDNSKIKRTKTDKDNLYYKDDEEYKAFGQGVPEEITKVINFSDVNIQYQMDAPFLLSETSGEVARHFNKIVNLEQIDESLKSADSALRKINQDIKYCHAELEKEEAELLDYEWIDEAKIEFKALELLSNKESETRKEFSQLTAKTSDARQIKESFIIIDFEAAEKELQRIFKQTEKITELEEKITAIKKLKNDISEIEKELINIDYLEAEKILAILKQLSEQQKEIESACIKLNVDIEEMENIEKEMYAAEQWVITTEKELQSIMPDVCPLCGQEINHVE